MNANLEWVSPVQKFKPRSMVDALFSIAAQERRKASECGRKDPDGWEAHRSRAILLEQQALDIQDYGFTRASLRWKLIKVYSEYMDGKRELPRGIINRISNALENKPVYEMRPAWKRYLKAEAQIQSH